MADEWYYTNDGKQLGPISAAQLKQMAVNQQLQPTDLVWKQGMATWVPAGTAKGLFPEAAQPAAVERTAVAPLDEEVADERPTRRRRVEEDGDLDDRPRRRRREEGDDEDYAPRRRRRSRPGSNKGLLIGLIVGGGVLLLLGGVGVVVLIVVLVSRGGPGSYTINLLPGEHNIRTVYFTTKTTEVTVTSDHNSDVDLYIEDSGGRQLASDVSIGPNSRIVFTPPRSGSYRLIVVNLGPISNRSHVRYN